MCGQVKSNYPHPETNGHDDSTKAGCSNNPGTEFPDGDETGSGSAV